MKSNSITIRKRILAGSKVGSGGGRACALRHFTLEYRLIEGMLTAPCND